MDHIRDLTACNFDKLLLRLTGVRPVSDLSRTLAAQTLADAANAFRFQKPKCELGIAFAYVLQALKHASAAEQLRFKALTARALFQQGVDHQLHRIYAVAQARPVALVLPGKQEMVHPADTGYRIADAGGDA